MNPQSMFRLNVRLNKGRYGMPAVAQGQRIYIVGGSTADQFSSDIEIFDTATGKIERKETKLLPRRWHTAQLVDGWIYVCGGCAYTDSNKTADVEKYEIATGKIEKCAPLPTPRRMVNSVQNDGKIWILGGSDKDGTYTGAVEIYDPKRNRWQKAPPMPTPRECAVALHNNFIYAIGGYNGTEGLMTIEAYSILQARWQRLPDMPFVLSANHVAVLGETLYSFGDYINQDRVACYSFARRTWRLLTGTGFKPNRHNAVAAVGNTIYVFGGNTAPTEPPLDTIQAFRF
jgi:N-acetylneuraminic acid mutarotase